MRVLLWVLLAMLIITPAITRAQVPPPSTKRPAAQVADAVKVCQVGYLTGEAKFAMLTASPTGDVLVRRAHDDRIVLNVAAGAPTRDTNSGDEIRAVDFSKLRDTGTYYLDVPGVGASYPFRVGDDVFARAFRASMRAFTGQRCGTAVSLAPDFPEFRYGACHTVDAQFHPSSGKAGKCACTGGWHDAGDYGRYVVNSGITTGTLLWAYELNAGKLRNLNLDLPESGGPLPDMLAEIKWNLDWMLKMQDPTDGGVWHKATTASFPGFIMPEEDGSPVLIVGSGHAPYKTAEATADLAAVAAIAARVFREFDPAYADRCLAAARSAFAWAEAHPHAHFQKNPDGIQTGGYGDKDSSDERLWAAAELFRTTGDSAFDEYFLAHFTNWKPTLDGGAAQGWPDVHNLGMYAYALTGRGRPAAVALIKSDAVSAADAIVRRSLQNGYRIPLRSNEYYWGSNSVVANYAMMVLLANRFSPDAKYVNCAQDALHYLLGRNTFSTSFVTQLGSRWPMRPHHRPSAADGVEQPWPGMLVGGPNADVKTTAPARQWHDDDGDYKTNEIAINWNAPLVFLLADALPAAPAGAAGAAGQTGSER